MGKTALMNKIHNYVKKEGKREKFDIYTTYTLETYIGIIETRTTLTYDMGLSSIADGLDGLDGEIIYYLEIYVDDEEITKKKILKEIVEKLNL